MDQPGHIPRFEEQHRIDVGVADPGAEVQMKITDKHHAWVKGPGGPELQVIVVKRFSANEDTPVQK